MENNSCFLQETSFDSNRKLAVQFYIYYEKAKEYLKKNDLVSYTKEIKDYVRTALDMFKINSNFEMARVVSLPIIENQKYIDFFYNVIAQNLREYLLNEFCDNPKNDKQTTENVIFEDKSGMFLVPANTSSKSEHLNNTISSWLKNVNMSEIIKLQEVDLGFTTTFVWAWNSQFLYDYSLKHNTFSYFNLPTHMDFSLISLLPLYHNTQYEWILPDSKTILAFQNFLTDEIGKKVYPGEDNLFYTVQMLNFTRQAQISNFTPTFQCVQKFLPSLIEEYKNHNKKNPEKTEKSF